MKVLVLFFTFTQILLAKSFFVYTESSKLINEYQHSAVFTAKEKEFLKDSSVNTNVYQVEIKESQLSSFLRQMKSQGIKIEEMPKANFYNQYADKQWALNNDGRIHRNFITDIDVQTVQGIIGEDIQLGSLKEKDTKIRVAIIDSGVDVEHPDLKNKIITNELECRDLELYKKCMRQNSDRQFCKDTYASLDHNQNGYPLDCHGWNLSDTQLTPDLDGGPSISDSVGHGTHVTGIIAAEDNEIGIKGVIQNVEILPVQVGVSTAYYQSDDVPADKIAKGVLYAIKNQVDVINLSLGWRISQDSTLMREMIELAIKNNIIIVAAGGNDGHTSPVYPCSYDDVICVGAHNEAGKLADFSNHGFHLDLLAPGTNILSTWPRNLRSKKFTINDNYEYMSGTSQAAPYVTGVIALLLNQGIPKNHIKQVLYRGTRENSSKKDIKFGNLDFKKALNSSNSEGLIIPAQKSPALISWSEDKEEYSFLLKLKNISHKAESKNLKIDSLNKSITILNSEISIENLKANEVFETRIHIKAPYNSDARQSFKLKLGSDTYAFSTKAISLINNDHPLALNILSEKDLNGVSFKSFENYVDHKIDLLGIKEVGNKTQIILIKDEDSHYTSSAFLNLPAIRPVFLKLSKVDLDLNGSAEYVITVVENKSSDERVTKFFIFDKDLKPQRVEIFPKNTFDNQLTVLPGSFEWVKMQGRMLPMWIGRGERDESEREVNDPWAQAQPERRESRLYYLAPEGLRTVKFPKDVYPIQSLYAQKDSKLAGKFSFITTNTYNFYKTYQLYQFQDELKLIQSFELSPYMDLVSTRPLPLSTSANTENAYFHSLSTNGDLRVSAISLDSSNHLSIDHDIIYNQGSDSLIRLLRYDGHEAIGQTFYELQNAQSSILSRVDIQRIKHHLLRTKLALYLPLSESLDFGSEYITTDAHGNLYSPAHKSFFPINDCSEIETYGDSQVDMVIFLCKETKKLIKLNL
tara:strand:+ start:256794 stop:259721 length:2928 start_codon:yes stop_codon:yes gene_type:complete